MLLIRATDVQTGIRHTLTVEERATSPRLVVTESDGTRLDLAYIDIGHFLEDWTRLVREDHEERPDG